MSNLLALDVGRKHTGVAYCDASVDIPMPLDTIDHESDEELIESLQKLITEREVKTLVLGLPLMSDGTEGEEVEHVQEVASHILEQCPNCTIEFIDERLTNAAEGEDHSGAAVAILRVFRERSKKSP